MGVLSWRFRGGQKTPVLYILAISHSYQVGLEWYQKQMWNPHNEAPWRNFFAKLLKFGQVIAIFVRLTKFQKQVKKNQERAFFGNFWIKPKKLFHSNFQTMPKFYESSKTKYSDSTFFINRLTPLFFRVLEIFRGVKWGFPPKISIFFCFSLLLIH